MKAKTTAPRSLRGAVVAAACLAASTTASAVPWDAAQFKAYGGTYSTHCADPTAPRLIITRDALVVERGNTRLSGHGIDNAVSYLGQSPPPGFEAALLTQRGSAAGLTFVVYSDRAGRFIQVEGDPKVQALLGKAQMSAKHRDCDTARSQSTGAAAVRQQREAAREAAREPAALTDPRFKAAYHRALGPRISERWLARLEGPAPEPRKVRVAGAEYLLRSVCKPHDCADNNIVLLYSGERGVVYGKLLERGSISALIGSPPPVVAAELDRLWKAEWRQRR